MAAMDRFKDPPTWLKVATTQEIDLQPWAPRQWTSTTTRWWCGLILLPSLTLRSPHPQGDCGRQGHIYPTSINQSNPVLLKERVRIPSTRRAGGTALLWGALLCLRHGAFWGCTPAPLTKLVADDLPTQGAWGSAANSLFLLEYYSLRSRRLGFLCF